MTKHDHYLLAEILRYCRHNIATVSHELYCEPDDFAEGVAAIEASLSDTENVCEEAFETVPNAKTEKALRGLKADGYSHLTMDAVGYIYAWKPSCVKNESIDEWVRNAYGCAEIAPHGNLLDLVSWSDEEPRLISDLLARCRVQKSDRPMQQHETAKNNNISPAL